MMNLYAVLLIIFIVRTASTNGLDRHEQLSQQQQRQEGEVRMFSLNRGVWTKPSLDVFLRYNFSSDRVTQFTVCYRIRFERFAKLTTHLSYVDNDANMDSLGIYHAQSHLMVWFNGDSQVREEDVADWDPAPETWNHFCLVFSSSTFTIYTQGEEIFRKHLKSGWSLRLNGSLVLGQEQDALGGGFDLAQVMLGDIAQVSFWDRPLTIPEIEEMATCRTLGQGNVFSSDTASLEVYGSTVQWVNVETLCSSSRGHYFVILLEERSLVEAVSLCQLMNTSLAVPSNSSENLHLTQELQPHQHICSPEKEGKLWLGISDSQEEGVWRNVVTNNPVDYLNFAPTYPHGSTFYGCALLTVTGFWHDTTCLYMNKNCAGCMVNRSSYLYLRGFCFDIEHQNRFRLSGYTDERAHFLGFYGLLIAWEATNKRWVFYDIFENSTYMHLHNLAADGYPLGKHEWVTNIEICGVPKGNDMTLSLSPCNENQYMCRSGQCITLQQRCDLNNDCIDRSDEFNCGKVVISDEYQRELPPANVRGNVLKLSPELRLLRVANVEDISMAINVELQVILQWVDDRLSFRHLTVSRSGSILTEEEVQLIWTPRYQLINLEGGKMELLEESVIITTANNATASHFNDINMDPIYPGDSNNLSIISHYTARFTCLFRFFAYPFDIQLCTIELHLPSIYEGKVEFSEDDAAVNYSGVMDLALYTIRDVSIGSGSGANQVIMEFKLHRRPGVIMLSTFLPSSLLLLVSWSTLFIKLDALNVRAIMSLTTLLVLYTLFSNLSSSLPATAEIKLIDIWFFFIISILFVNIMMNVFVRDDVKILSPRPQKVIRVLPVPYKAPASVSHKIYVSVRFLTIYKIVIIPVMIIVFNIFFWVAVFL